MSATSARRQRGNVDVVTAPDVVIRRLERVDELDALEPLWLALHGHHRTVLPERLLVADDAVSWQGRRDVYRGWLESGTALALLAERDGHLVGYAFAHLIDGPDETFAVGRRYAELYSLAVAPEARSGGIGTRLLDELDRQLAAVSIVDLVVAVMTDNHAARRFYERRGLLPVETVYWRIATAASD
jgi:ribosomal protein S18 acetylase RimI-like enzyme